MKKLTSKMLKGVGIDVEFFEDSFPDGMSINAENILTLSSNFEIDIIEIISRLLPLDIFISYEKECDKITEKYEGSIDKFSAEFNLAIYGYKETYRDATRKLTEKYNKQIKDYSKVLHDQIDSIIENELKEKDKAALKALKNCEQIRCIGKTM